MRASMARVHGGVTIEATPVPKGLLRRSTIGAVLTTLWIAIVVIVVLGGIITLFTYRQ